MKIDARVEDSYQILAVIFPNGLDRTLILPWAHCYALPKHQLRDGAPLNGSNGSTGGGSATEIDELIDGGYAIRFTGRIGETLLIVALIQS